MSLITKDGPIVRIMVADGTLTEHRVSFDFVVLYEDELVGAEIVGIYIGQVPVQDINGRTLARGEKPWKKSAGQRLIIAEETIIHTLHLLEEKRMSAQDKPKPGMLVEDSSVVAGTDKETGATVIKPKTTDGRADESVEPTDKREK